jgi:hypothetical protein
MKRQILCEIVISFLFVKWCFVGIANVWMNQNNKLCNEYGNKLDRSSTNNLRLLTYVLGTMFKDS